jgi:hypothetical protein
MTAAVGIDLGAEMAGAQAGKGQSPVAAARLGRELSTNWLKPGSGNLATGMASEAPSFRSSWQSQVNAWRGISRGTNGVESQDTNDAGTVDTMNGVPRSLAAKDEQTLASAQRSSSSLLLNGARTQQNEPVPDVAGQKGTLPQRSHFAAEGADNTPTQTTVTESTSTTTATERPGAATRSRASFAAPPVEEKNTAQAAYVGTNALAPGIEAPILIPAAPVRSAIPMAAQTVETTSASESNLASASWRSAGFSGSAQLSVTEEIANAATATLATGASGGGGTAGARTRTMQAGQALMAHSVAGSEAAHQSAASSLDDAEESAANRQMTSPSSLEVRSAESWREPSIARTAGASETLSGQPTSTLSTGNLDHAATFGSTASSAAPVSAPVQASLDAVQAASKQSTDRAAARATNRDATAAGVPSATQVSLAPPAGVDAAATSGLRIPGAPQVSAAFAPHVPPAAAAATTVTGDTFSALDAGHDAGLNAGLDAGPSPGTLSWTHAGSQHAEAGFRDPSLGWVSVRADLNGGGIHATLVPSSTDAAQALNGHLAGLSTHLVEQQSPVASLTMASPSESGVENGMGQRMQQGAEGNPQGSAPEEAQAGAQEHALPASGTSALNAPAQAGNRDALTHLGDLRGTHISVMA